ncbi:hypothetical protein L211DRAFT_592885 [Terfezia boudieri ATCC MYA-4762]|uniref:Uncharacterized protein n=1 Tax=Terfezia boudieri ATCC MYA-4762 TaxID=1051890 RepID=A0A3N4L9V4_9PEZI|nr:hypothetical protein L211DRAFT_592885 [Terfezia boudieri ATCC MYA-4762]
MCLPQCMRPTGHVSLSLFLACQYVILSYISPGTISFAWSLPLLHSPVFNKNIQFSSGSVRDHVYSATLGIWSHLNILLPLLHRTARPVFCSLRPGSCLLPLPVRLLPGLRTSWYLSRRVHLIIRGTSSSLETYVVHK